LQLDIALLFQNSVKIRLFAAVVTMYTFFPDTVYICAVSQKMSPR